MSEELKSMEELKKLLEDEEKRKEFEAYAKAKAESETKALADIATDTNKTLSTKLNTHLAQKIDNDEKVADKIEDMASKLVDKGLKVQENKVDADLLQTEDDILVADYEKYKNEYLYHGIDHKIDKKWKKNLVLWMNDIWFVIWAIVSFFTIVPVSTFLSRINALKGFIKGVAIVLGIVLLLACLFGVTVLILRKCGINIF